MLSYSDMRETSFGDEDKHEVMSLADMQGETTDLQKATDEDFDEMRSSAFLPRLNLMTAKSAPCTAGEFPTNHYALIRDQQHQDLGKDVDVLVCSWRPMALAWGAETASSHDRKSEMFLDIQARADKKEDGFMWGYQTLVWIPSVGCFAVNFAGSPTARRAFPGIKALMKQPATFGSQKIDNGKNIWFGPTASECSTPFDMPPKDEYLTQMEKFNNPAESDVELAEEDDRAQ